MAQHKRIVTVTGATRFVGRYLVAHLVQQGDYEVRCLVRPESVKQATSPKREQN